MTEIINYKFGQKNNWRNATWNALRDGCTDVKNAKVLYLPGPDALDIPVATRKGFQLRNMYGVSNDLKIVDKLRKEKIPVIHGDIIDVAFSFREKFDVLHLDLTTGIDQDYKRIAIAFSSCVKIGGMMLLNMQRGRDSFSNYERKLLADKIFPLMDKYRTKNINTEIESEKHRGMNMYFLIMFYLCYVWCDNNRLDIHQNASEWFSAFSFRCRKKLWSYKSNIVRMDSIVIKNGMFDNIMCLDGKIPLKPKYGAGLSCEIASSTELRRQIAAVKATVTRRYR